MILVSPVIWLVATIFQAVIDVVACVVELTASLVYAAWVALIQAVLALLEGINDLLPEYDLVDNAIGRAVVMGVIGVAVGFVLMIFLLVISGLWCIPFGFMCTAMAFVFLGIAASPDHDWNLNNFPRFRSGGGTGTPLNL